jgi:hypothetical protein
MNAVANHIDLFERVSLAEMDSVKLMNRTDKKFCLHLSQLPEILNNITPYYNVLAIQDKTIMPYDTVYFDTPDDQMYLCHQNGKLNRYKVRSRKYVVSDDTFLEIKFKNNKGRTLKERISRKDDSLSLYPDELAFLNDGTPYNSTLLVPKIRSLFNRITLVNKEFTDRVTIDLLPGFDNGTASVQLKNLVIVEVKQSKSSRPARIVEELQQHKIRMAGFSKYCMGRALLEPKLKKNNFKPQLLRIHKDFSN